MKTRKEEKKQTRMPPRSKRARSGSAPPPAPPLAPATPGSPLAAARARQQAQADAWAIAAGCRVGDAVTFEWRDVDARSEAEEVAWTPWCGLVESLEPLTIRWNADCEELAAPLSTWPVRPILADPKLQLRTANLPVRQRHARAAADRKQEPDASSCICPRYHGRTMFYCRSKKRRPQSRRCRREVVKSVEPPLLPPVHKVSTR
ncbi:unnamed protein product [Bodo saltans]|uniref:Uncharacterized protein n=1 Tax=Bodo saltans TaxID=75058 RepID=A0A0S4KJE9_BODSA|nr:unnamed protein product [Bodo saltans]|eukprot:CUI14515.1 unnamed protein product [Bodo saltans]